MSEDPFGRSSKEPEADIGADAAKARIVRKGDIGVECSKGLLPAISTSGGVAAKLRFRVCSEGHAGAYGVGVVIDILLDNN